jgi:hypothetical protein
MIAGLQAGLGDHMAEVAALRRYYLQVIITLFPAWSISSWFRVCSYKTAYPEYDLLATEEDIWHSLFSHIPAKGISCEEYVPIRLLKSCPKGCRQSEI